MWKLLVISFSHKDSVSQDSGKQIQSKMIAQHNAKISTCKCYNQAHAIYFSAFINKFGNRCFLYLEKGRQRSLVSVFLLYNSFIQLPLNGWMAASTINPSLCIFTLIILAYYTPVISLSCFALSL